MLSAKLDTMIHKFVDGEITCNRHELYISTKAYVENHLGQYLANETAKERELWLWDTVFKIEHCGLKPRAKMSRQDIIMSMRITESKKILNALKRFI